MNTASSKAVTPRPRPGSGQIPRAIPVLIAEAIGAKRQQVDAAIALLDGGATVPFISRYRKEATGGLSDSQLRLLDEKLDYLRDLDSRRSSIISLIEEQGKLSDQLATQIASAQTKAELEDLYLPYKKKRRTKGQIAIEAGLEPLADLLWNEPDNEPGKEALRFIVAGSDGVDSLVPDEKSALDGARFILMERFAEDASLIARLRDLIQNQGFLCANLISGKDREGAKFQDYFDHQESFARIPGHRALAMFRGRSEGILGLNLLFKDGDSYSDASCISTVASHLGFRHQQKAADDWRAQVVSWTWKVKLSLHLESELLSTLRSRADAEAISVFAANLQDLLLAAPAGPRATLGLDPGFRSGVKVTVIDSTGKVVDHTAVYPHKPQQQWPQAMSTLHKMCVKHSVELIAVGNGTASRETEKLADELIQIIRKGDKGALLTKVVVSEAGASVYSASKTAEDEFPDLDVTIRGAISIARRLQDPLAELVKIDPKAIGVGQYQHDVSQTALAKSLDATVEDCVNAVGVDLDTASAALLSRVAGLTPTIATNIVAYRDEQGAFKNRKELTKVPRLGPKAFEQAAGFLRIPNSSDPLDASGVHPESYPVVQRIIEFLKLPLAEVIGNSAVLRTLSAEQFVDEKFGVPTVQDIIAELDKPGRDPRPEFRAVQFADGVESVSDLVPNQILEGKVTNVTAFGAFVDVGVHQDGLVHISALSDTFVKDPRDVVKAGDIVKVKVMAIDIARARIGLSMRMSDDAEDAQERGSRRPSPVLAGRSQGANGANPGDAKKPESKRHRQAQQADMTSSLALSLKAALEGK
jgi:uncharacterized protein